MPPAPRLTPGGTVGARALDALLQDLGPHLRRGEAPRDPLGRSATGLAQVDRVLGGGFPRGQLSEIVGPVFSGRTSLALSLLATTTRAGEFAGMVDACDALDPPSAEAAGVDLSRVLWVRARETKAALRSAERLLEARGFALVLLDLADDLCDEPARPPVPQAAWPRLVRAAAASATSLVVIGSQRLAGTFSAQSVELDPARAHFSGTPVLLESLEGRLLLVRNRSGPSHRSAPLQPRASLRADPRPAKPPHGDAA